LTLRISLDRQGRPLMVDAMNNCGCYHLFAPPSDSGLTPRPLKAQPDGYVPQKLPAAFPAHRLALRISAGWHQIQRLLAPPPEIDLAYTLLPYDALEALPDPAGRSASIFDRRGIVKRTGRVEPLIFFSMGIPDIGAMRQRGHHAIELVGRAHFDDPFLFERHFVQH
jgi:hypothetical protein